MSHLTISTLISALHGVMEEHGDLPVYFTGEYTEPMSDYDIMFLPASRQAWGTDALGSPLFDEEYPDRVGVMTG